MKTKKQREQELLEQYQKRFLELHKKQELTWKRYTELVKEILGKID